MRSSGFSSGDLLLSEFMIWANPFEKAYSAPFIAFMAMIFVSSIIAGVFDGHAFWALSEPKYWMMPAQIVVCGFLLFKWWSSYQWSESSATPFRTLSIGTGIGLLALIIWVAPQAFFNAPARTDGFQPGFFGESGFPYWGNVGLRFFRLVIIVPIVEELFWRGFLMRFLVNESDFRSVPIGTFTMKSFLITTAGFCLEHSPTDYPAAIAVGLLFNGVAYWTRSLTACVLAHAVTNLALGIYVMKTGQWGFW